MCGTAGCNAGTALRTQPVLQLQLGRGYTIVQKATEARHSDIIFTDQTTACVIRLPSGHGSLVCPLYVTSSGREIAVSMPSATIPYYAVSQTWCLLRLLRQVSRLTSCTPSSGHWLCWCAYGPCDPKSRSRQHARNTSADVVRFADCAGLVSDWLGSVLMPSWYFGLFVALERQPRRKLKGFPVPEDYRAALGPDSRSSSFATYQVGGGCDFLHRGRTSEHRWEGLQQSCHLSRSCGDRTDVACRGGSKGQFARAWLGPLKLVTAAFLAADK